MAESAGAEKLDALLTAFTEGLSRNDLEAVNGRRLRRAATAFLEAQGRSADAAAREVMPLRYTPLLRDLPVPQRGIVGYALCIDALERLSKQPDSRRRDLERIRAPRVRELFERLVVAVGRDGSTSAASTDVFVELGDDVETNRQRLLSTPEETLRATAATLVQTKLDESTVRRVEEALAAARADERLAAKTWILEAVLFAAAAWDAFPLTSPPFELAACVVDNARLLTAPSELREEIQEEARRAYPVLEELSIAEADPKLGTTSFLLRCTGDTERAVKCVFPRYWSGHVGDATAAARCPSQAYERVLEGLFPAVSRADRHGIQMEYVEGRTIAEARNALWSRVAAASAAQPRADHRGSPLPDVVLDAVSDCVTGIAEQLERLARANPTAVVGKLDEECAKSFKLADFHPFHLDLSPDNVILKKDQSRRERDEPEHATDRDSWNRTALIDFGVNYTIREGTIAGDRIEHARTFIAPEVRRTGHGGQLSDIYSLGVIALEVASPGLVKIGMLDDQLDELWERAPFLARLIEDMIDDEPRNRAIGHPGRAEGDWGRVYSGLAATAVKATQAEKDAAAPPTGVRHALTELLRDLLPPRPKLQDIRDVRWSKAYHATWWFTAALMAAILVRRWHTLGNVFGDVPLLDRLVAAGTSNAALYAQLVAMSTAFIAYRYYVYIFASLGPTPDAKLPGWTARTFPLAAMLLQIAALLHPLPLALPGGIGGMLIALNNYLWFDVTDRTSTIVLRRNISTVGNYYAEFASRFKPWWSLMLIYGAVGVAVGALLSSGAAHDAWLWALIVGVFGNLFKLYYFNICKDGALVRAGLSRALFLLERDRLAVGRRDTSSERLPETAAATAP